MTAQATNRTVQHWDIDPWDTLGTVFWLQLRQVKQRMAIKESGTLDGDWVDYTLKTHFAGQLPLQRCLSLGCGRGRVERQWAENGAFLDCDAYDISPSSIADAQAQAAAAGYKGIHYAVVDINQIDLPANQYNAVWAAGSAHHFNQLERIFSQVAQALKPGGVFILHEYIGPNRFQFPPAQRQAIQACLDLLPPAYRRLSPQVARARLSGEGQSPRGRSRPRILPQNFAQRLLDKWRDGDLAAAATRRLQLLRAVRQGSGLEKTSANLPTERSVIAVDPSEAIRSADIVPLLQQQFDIVEFKPLGGTILQFLLADIAGNFERDANGARLLQMLFEIEDSLIETGVLQSDFAYIVARPKRGGSG